jgi:hypothetical protein
LLTVSFFSATQTLNAQAVKAEFVFCATGDSVCESNNRVRQDRANSPYIDGVDDVTAVFALNGGDDLVIQLGRTRRLKLDLRDIAHYGNPHPSWWTSAPQQIVNPGINVDQALQAKKRCVPDAAGNCEYNFVTRMNCGIWYAAGDRKTQYRLQWNPTSIFTFINTPETTSQVNVRYVRDGSGEVFIITPLPNTASGRIIAGVQSTSNRTDRSAGQYVMPFKLTVRFK